MKKIAIVLFASCLLLWTLGALFDQAMADVSGAGSTTNTQSTTGSSATNTAITGGYHSEASTTYATGASSNSTTNNDTTNNNNSYTGDTRTVNSANAPALSNMSQDICTIGIGVGASSFSLSASIGTHKRDINCERLKLAKALHDMNMRVASIALLCQSPMVFEAMAHAGTSCPAYGLIGAEAEEYWKQYPELRPDFEEYTKNLKYTTGVDDKKQADLEAEENDKAVVNFNCADGEQYCTQ
jgi:hypothetical protein|tara:strand:+ start:494 stop:1216 length:723 start_codon:yes stop_codon:yes gene_type:complete